MIISSISVLIVYASVVKSKNNDFRLEELITCISLVVLVMIPVYFLSYSYFFDNKKCFKKRIEIYKLLKSNDNITSFIDDFLIYDYNDKTKKYICDKIELYFSDSIDISNYNIDDLKSLETLIIDIKKTKVSIELEQMKKLLLKDLKRYKKDELIISKIILDYENGELIKKHLTDSVNIIVTIISLMLSLFGLTSSIILNNKIEIIYLVFYLALVVDIVIEIFYNFTNKDKIYYVYKCAYLDLKDILMNNKDKIPS